MANELQRQTSLELLNLVEGLPTLPDRFLFIQEVLNDPKSSLASITKLVETDQATTVTIMKIANSAHYNPIGKPMSNLSFAISRLGRKVTGDIALSMALLYGFSFPAGISVVRKFWAHAYATSQITRHLTVKGPFQGELNSDALFLASLLHDIGRAVIGIRIDLDYFESNLSRLDDLELMEAEKEAYGIDHAETGKIILDLWGLPTEVSNIVANHHSTLSDRTIEVFQLAQKFTHKYFDNSTSIEDVQIKLDDVLLEQILEEAFPTEELLEELAED